ncbi:MAG: hypothetical protein AAB316_16570 [Bacteroidota bacterium]
MIEFDQNGNLTPSTAIETSVDECQEYLVKKFQTSISRAAIFENYLRYLENFKREITEDFFQFVNGSFATRKPNPNDLDVVTFIDFKVYNSLKVSWDSLNREETIRELMPTLKKS